MSANDNTLKELDMVKAHMQGVVEGLDLARRILSGQDKTQVAEMVANINIGPIVALPPPEYIPASLRDDDEDEDDSELEPASQEPPPKRNPASHPINGRFQKASERIKQADDRRLTIARLIATGGPRTISEIGHALDMTYSTAYNSVHRHDWFDLNGKHIHLSPVGLAAVREADGKASIES